ncbi:MAG: hypothetical protein QOJ34_1940 [Pseudonocardiales bacterium]|jgi:hypothetical protein|nr:hypothetical protein [Pseudonocardiales bacterium]
MTRTRAAVTAASIVAVGLLTCSACTGGGDAAPSSAGSTSPSSTPAPTKSTPKPKPEAKPMNPFTGLGPVPKRPTVSVKIDDTAPGRPQVGINQADIVYVEAVEGGLTRLAAIFGTNHPKAVGYVRSTRPSDPDLLLQYGRITAAYSGGAHDSLPRIHRSGIRSWSNDDGARFYARRYRGASSYINLVLNVAKVAAQVKTPPPHSIGWTFDRSLSGLPVRTGRTVRTEVTGSYDHGTPVVFHYSRKLDEYVRYIDGVRQMSSSGHPVTARNVIVQECRIVPHPKDTDVNGNPSQFTYTVGHGPAVVFRNGKRIDGTWHRRKLFEGTVWRTANGQRIPLMPGNTWVILVRKGIPVFSH